MAIDQTPDTAEASPEFWRKSFYLTYQRAAAIIMKRLNHHYQSKYGIEVRAAWVLMCASELPCSQGYLATQLVINPNTMVQVIDRMEASGLVKRVKQQGNRRAYVITVTAAGKKVLEAIHRTFNEVALASFHPLAPETIESLKAAYLIVIDAETQKAGHQTQ